jgi:cobalt-zinc-cadmium efflux system membrane fusion protein
MNDNSFSNDVMTLTPPPARSSGATHETTSQPRRRWLSESGATAVVILALAGVAIWGHQTGWTMPKFSELFATAKEPDDWCPEHSVPESICVECNEALMPRIKDTYCRLHGVHNCPFERPDVAQLKSPPAITPEMLAMAQRALDLKERPENSPKGKKHHRRIQFASLEAMEKMGVDVAPVWRGPIVETIAASGEIAFEQPRVAPISSMVSGRIWYLTNQAVLGTAVKRGDVMALVDSMEIGKAKGELLQARAQLELKSKVEDSLKKFVETGTTPKVQLLEAEAATREALIRVKSAQQALANLGLPMSIDDILAASSDSLAGRLHFFGIPDAIASRLDPKTTSSNLFPIMAPRDGIVTTAKAAVGEVVDPTKVLFVVADTSRMWLLLNIRNEDLKYVRVRDAAGNPGQRVLFRPDGSDKDVEGELVWKSASVDEKTRTIQMRAEVPNPDGKLLANTFGAGRIVLREEKQAMVIPNEAIHWEGDCTIVFVQDKHFHEPNGLKVFHVRTIRPGVRNGASTEVIAGLLPGEVVATTNSASLRAEMLKNNLGAGCGCCH